MREKKKTIGKKDRDNQLIKWLEDKKQELKKDGCTDEEITTILNRITEAEKVKFKWSDH